MSSRPAEIPSTQQPTIKSGNGETTSGSRPTSGIIIGQPGMSSGQQRNSENLTLAISQSNASNDEEGQPKKSRYYRHSQHQIQELEAFFKNNSRLDYKKRSELGSRLGLTPMQIKFWFQNKRSQMKIRKAKTENHQLHFQTEELAFEIRRLKDMIKNSCCSRCGRPTGLAEMLDDSARMREEASGLALGNTSIDPESFRMQQSAAQPIMPCIGLPEQVKKQLILGIAVSAMEELIKMANIGTPLWTTSTSSNTCFLNEEEYHIMFPQANRIMPTGFKCESSRETALIMINPLKLVEILMDMFQWTTVFAAIVARAITHDVVEPRVAGSYNGSLQVLTAEYQVPSPLSPNREAYFARYCRHLEDGGWAVVDVSLDSLCPLPLVSCRRRPSGCLIHDNMPNGYSKVTWVEHVDVDDRGDHNMYSAFVNSGLAFGAKSWISILDRQCERLASVMAPPFPTTSSETIEGRKSMLNLAERIVTSFCSSISDSKGHAWTTLFGKGDDDVRIMIRNIEAHSGSPLGVVLNAAISFKLPVHPNIVFDFLRSPDTRTQWDILSLGGELQELAHIANGRDTGNRVSLFRVIIDDTTMNMFILQESIIGPTGCFVVYAPLDVVTINKVLSGEDSTLVEILPSGFAIVPDGNIESGQYGCGSVVTAQFQILVNASPTTVDTSPTTILYLDSVTAINTLVTTIVNKIKDAMGGSSSAGAARNT